MLPWVLALLVLVLAVALFVAGRADARPRAAVCDVFGKEEAEDPLHDTGEVLIPWARLDVGVGAPTDELPELRGAPSTLAAPEGGSFVRVQARVAEQIPTFVTRQPYVTQVDLVLHADGRDHPVSSPGNLDFDPNGTDTRGGDRWAAVEGHPKDLEVRVTVNGQTQAVDADGKVDAGGAARLDENPIADEIREVDKVACGTFRTRRDAGPAVAHPKMVKVLGHTGRAYAVRRRAGLGRSRTRVPGCPVRAAGARRRRHRPRRTEVFHPVQGLQCSHP